MTKTALLMDPLFKHHDTGPFHPESPDRLTAIENALAPLVPQLLPIPARDATDDELTLVHAHAYLDQLQEDHLADRSQLSTGDTQLSYHSLEAARRATGGVLNAVDLLLAGKADSAFCAVRPPGHHATPTRGMGFCIFNHIAIAARYAQRKHGVGKILIVDWDVHHGNGTQDAFYADDSVLFFSSHQSPWYPGSGKRDETGTGRGLGCTINAPLPAGSGYRDIFHEIDLRLDRKVQEFKPEILLLSAGFDSRIDDPLGRFTLEDEQFVELTRLLRSWAGQFSNGKLLSVLEGGYNLQTLGPCVASHVRTLME
ncbi:MAG: histone deacetylase family protein [Phycisphaerae bacterium]